tara:strand:- start:1623 stop:2462 length:840 start_codon:yes stop_codon:yes gene_type:complete
MRKTTRKIGALMILSMFLLSVVPAAFAQVQVKPTVVVGQSIQAEKAEGPATVGAKITRDTNRPTTDRVKGKLRIAHAEDSRESRDRKKLLVARLKERKGQVSEHIKEVGREFDADRAEAVVEHALNFAEHLDAALSRLRNVMSNHQRFLDKNPKALGRIDNIRDSLGEIHDELTRVGADGITIEEWKTVVVPALRELKSQSKVKQFISKWRQYHNKRFAERMREKLPIIEKRLRAKGVADADATDRTVRIRKELASLERADVSREDVGASITRIKAALS